MDRDQILAIIREVTGWPESGEVAEWAERIADAIAGVSVDGPLETR
jgi:cytochrome c5